MNVQALSAVDILREWQWLFMSWCIVFVVVSIVDACFVPVSIGQSLGGIQSSFLVAGFGPFNLPYFIMLDGRL